MVDSIIQQVNSEAALAFQAIMRSKKYAQFNRGLPKIDHSGIHR